MSLRETATEVYDDEAGAWRCKRCGIMFDGMPASREDHDCKVDP